MNNLAQTLHKLDQQVFLILNDLNTPFFDFLFEWITYKYTWIPLYIILVLLMFRHYRWNGIAGLIGIGIAVAFADQITSGFMKPFFERLRPCHDPAINEQVHVVAGCGGQYGFASGHAANSFAVASFMYLILNKYYRYAYLLFIWAGLVAYSRIYVGVHYAGDIIAGAIIGTICGTLMYTMYYFFTDFLTRNKPENGIKNTHSG